MGLKTKIRHWLYDVRLEPVRHSYPLARLGSAHGGWTYVETDKLKNATVVSCGLGEDGSFDVELAAKYGGRVVIVDPTPRAVAHFKKITENFGKPASRGYADGGSQPVEAYDLAKVGKENLTLVEKALWREETTLKFFSPPDPSHVSHSISNFSNHYRQDTAHIEVQAVTIDSLLKSLGVTQVPLMKIDIEGAEIEVIQDMLNRKIFPEQILVEYDELIFVCKKTKQRVGGTHDLLLRNGYQLLHFALPNNCLYYRPS